MTLPSEIEAAEILRAHLEALRAADVEALRGTVSDRLATQLDDPGFAARLEVMSQLVPDEYVVGAFAEEGDRASLEVETERQAGLFELVREGGTWKVAGQRWTARERRAPS